MSLIYFNIQGNNQGGGPNTFAHKCTTELLRRGYKITYRCAPNVDAAICIISCSKELRKMPQAKTILRIDGIYNKIYNEKFNRAIRPDMKVLHEELLRDIPRVSHTVYQSLWSKNRIGDEIVKVDKNYSIIHNGVDTNLFKPTLSINKSKPLNLIHIGKMRDSYLMEMLVGTYKEVKRRGYKVTLTIVGSMDGGCHGVLKKHGKDLGIIVIKNTPNNKLPGLYSLGDIFLGVRQGTSCDNATVEAQSCGIPVLTPAWGGSAELIVDGKTGLVIDCGKWDYNDAYINNLADGVDKIIPDLIGFKKRSREHAVKNLSVGIMVDKYIRAMK